jgi:hypothetical protein
MMGGKSERPERSGLKSILSTLKETYIESKFDKSKVYD